jgi:hypothetical protein
MSFKNGFSNCTKNITNLLNILLHLRRKLNRLLFLQESGSFIVQKLLGVARMLLIPAHQSTDLILINMNN